MSIMNAESHGDFFLQMLKQRREKLHVEEVGFSSNLVSLVID